MMIMMIKLKMRWGLRIPRMGEIRDSYKILVNPEFNRSFRRLSRRYQDNIKVSVKAVVWQCIGLTCLRWRALVSMVLKRRVS
jgi:hypothetical protein